MQGLGGFGLTGRRKKDRAYHYQGTGYIIVEIQDDSK
jgi:hypothetical protein